jgi:hypothetical protein
MGDGWAKNILLALAENIELVLTFTDVKLTQQQLNIRQS